MEGSLCEEHIFEAVYRENAQKLRNHLYYKCGDMSVSEDIMQESFLRLWNKCKEAVLESVGGYIYTIANRLFIDQVRSKKVNLKFEKSQYARDNHEDPHYLLRTEEFRDQLEKAISDLPEGQREAFLMNRIDKLTYKQIAETLHISETAVEKRMTKALLNLKTKVEELKSYKI